MRCYHTSHRNPSSRAQSISTGVRKYLGLVLALIVFALNAYPIQAGQAGLPLKEEILPHIDIMGTLLFPRPPPAMAASTAAPTAARNKSKGEAKGHPLCRKSDSTLRIRMNTPTRPPSAMAASTAAPTAARNTSKGEAPHLRSTSDRLQRELMITLTLRPDRKLFTLQGPSYSDAIAKSHQHTTPIAYRMARRNDLRSPWN